MLTNTHGSYLPRDSMPAVLFQSQLDSGKCSSTVAHALRTADMARRMTLLCAFAFLVAFTSAELSQAPTLHAMGQSCASPLHSFNSCRFPHSLLPLSPCQVNDALVADDQCWPPRTAHSLCQLQHITFIKPPVGATAAEGEIEEREVGAVFSPLRGCAADP